MLPAPELAGFNNFFIKGLLKIRSNLIKYANSVVE